MFDLDWAKHCGNMLLWSTWISKRVPFCKSGYMRISVCWTGSERCK